MMTLKEALDCSPGPPAILAAQCLIEVPFFTFAGAMRHGQLVVARELSLEVEMIFWEIYAARFPIAHMKPVVAFGWSDDDSMKANNCSGFNYRRKVGKSALSAHATGRAIDINPLQNPYLSDDVILPPDAVYDLNAPGTLLPSGKVVRAFESRGWIWGGRWTSLRDYHHFEKPLN